jgi:hypothetical protein
MSTYRILWTKDGTDGGWYVELAADNANDLVTDAFSQGVTAALADPAHTPRVVAIQAV